MFEKLMYIRTIIRAMVFIIKDRMPAKEAFEKSVEITRQEIDWVKYFEKKDAK